MPIFLDTRGNTNVGIGICDRCKMKRPLVQLKRDPNYPGLRVCEGVENGCQDRYDPWRLPARVSENINLPFVRPDVPLQDRAPYPVQTILAQRLVAQPSGEAILDSNGDYIVVDLPPEPEPD